MRVADLAWAAGIVDGEGYLGMTRAKVSVVSRRKTESFQIRISVRMTHKETIRKLFCLFGGTFKLARSRNPSRHNDNYEWYTGDLLTESVLRQLRPFLITKRKQAILLLAYRAKCSQPRGAVSCSSILVRRRARYFEKLKQLNKRGVL